MWGVNRASHIWVDSGIYVDVELSLRWWERLLRRRPLVVEVWEPKHIRVLGRPPEVVLDRWLDYWPVEN